MDAKDERATEYAVTWGSGYIVGIRDSAQFVRQRAANARQTADEARLHGSVYAAQQRQYAEQLDKLADDIESKGTPT